MVFNDGPIIAMKDGGVVWIIDNEMDHDEIHRFHDELVVLLDEALSRDGYQASS